MPRRKSYRSDLQPIYTQNMLGIKTDTGLDELIGYSQVRNAFAVCGQETWRTSRIFKNIFALWTRGLLRSRAAESSYILEGKAGRASIFSRIFSNMEVRGTLYILKDISRILV